MWYDCYLQFLSNEDQQSVREEKNETSFRFDDGKSFKSVKYVTLPTFIASKNILLTMEVIENDISLLLSKDAMKKAKTYVHFTKDKIVIFDEKVLLYYSWKNEWWKWKSPSSKNIVFFEDNLKNPYGNKKRNIPLTLHQQLSHPTAQKLISLLKDVNVDDNELRVMISYVTNNCEICFKYKTETNCWFSFSKMFQWNSSTWLEGIDFEYMVPSYNWSFDKIQHIMCN